jgi:hypothetical protein
MFPVTFLKTFVDLILRPRRVFEQKGDYLNPWKFTLPLGTTSIFVVKSLGLHKFNFEAIPTYLTLSSTSERLRDYFELQKNYETSYQFQVGLFMIIILMIPTFLLLFRKARTDFQKYFSATIYSSGILVFLIYLLMSICNLLGTSAETFVSISGIPVSAYFIYTWVSFFGSKIHVYLKLVSLLIASELLPPPSFNFLNLYVRIFQPQSILYPSVKEEKLIEVKTEPFRNYQKYIEMSDSASVLIYQIDSLTSFDLVGPNFSKNIGKRTGLLFVFLESDTLRSYYLINERQRKLVTEDLWPSKRKLDTLMIDMFFIRNVELINTNQHIFLGRDSLWQPSLMIYDRLYRQKRAIIFENPELRGQTFDRAFTISDSLAVITSYKLFENTRNSPIVTAYWCHLFNYKEGKIIRSSPAFERTGQYGLEEMPDFEIAPDLSMIISFTVANNQNHEFWITRLSTSDLGITWKTIIPVANDRIDGTTRLKYFKDKIYFLGNASLFIHKYWFESEVTYSFIGAIKPDGKNPEIKYFRQSKNHYSFLRGFYKLDNELYLTGIEEDNNINLFSILFPTKRSFSTKVSKNLP